MDVQVLGEELESGIPVRGKDMDFFLPVFQIGAIMLLNSSAVQQIVFADVGVSTGYKPTFSAQLAFGDLGRASLLIDGIL